MGAVKRELEAGWGDNFPVYWMSFVEAEAFCQRLTQTAALPARRT